MTYEGKAVLVTGGAGGIGRATAKAFAETGAAVLIIGSNADTLDQAAGEIGAACGATVRTRVVDVADPAQVAALFDSLEPPFDTLDIAINCAATEGTPALIEDIDLAAFRRTMQVNLEGVLLCMQGELRLMKQLGRGAIVNVASQAAHEGVPMMGHYTASKHALVGITKVAALENARSGIQINAVSPGFVDTPMPARLMAGQPGALAAMLATTPTGRMLQPEEVARSILFLASADAAQFLGQSLRLDGGCVDVQPSTLWHYAPRTPAQPA